MFVLKVKLTLVASLNNFKKNESDTFLCVRILYKLVHACCQYGHAHILAWLANR